MSLPCTDASSLGRLALPCHVAQTASVDWTRGGLEAAGFEGFVPFSELATAGVPTEPGVYLVLRAASERPTFRERSPAGWFKQRDPSVPPLRLGDVWVQDALVIYIGKASSGAWTARSPEASGGVPPSWAGRGGRPLGGRYIWQLQGSDRLQVAWKATPNDNPEDVKSLLIAEFVDTYGARPFANRKAGRRRLATNGGARTVFR